jgi:polyisoprenoid-binding protein YceI
MKKFMLSAFALTLVVNLSAQKYFTRYGVVRFNATVPSSPELIEATSTSSTMIIDFTTNKVESAVLIKSLQFERALMQEHFNENYMESSKYPKAYFKGEIVNVGAINLKKDGAYDIKLKGILTMHGVTKDVETVAKFTVKGEQISATANFEVQVADFKIDVPSLVSDKVAKSAKITISVDLKFLTN